MKKNKTPGFNAASAKNLNIEKEIFLLLIKTSEPKTLQEVKDRFKRRASLETTNKIINASSRLSLLDNFVAVAGHLSAHVSYKVTEGDVTRIWIDGKEGALPDGTVPSVRLFGDSYSFSLRIEKNGLSAFTFNTTAINVSDGTGRRLREAIVSNKSPFEDIVETIPNLVEAN